MDLDGRRQLRLVIGYFRPDAVDDVDGVGVGLPVHRQHDRRIPAVPCRDLLVFDGIVDFGDFVEAHGRAVAPGHDQIVVFGGVHHLAGDVDGDVLPAPEQRADRRRGIGGRDGVADGVERQAARGGRVGVDVDAHGEFLLAEHQHLRDAGDLRNLLGEDLFGVVVDLGQRQGLGGRAR